MTAHAQREPANASEAAQMLAALVPALPASTVETLLRLLAHSIAAPSAAERRELRLGLLLDLIADNQGVVPSVVEYREAREQRMKQDEEWPTDSTLIRGYGHWIAVVKAATRVSFEGPRARVPSSYRHSRRHSPYTRQEVIAALDECRRWTGEWPTQWIYEEWAKLRRGAARRAGLPEPRLPILKTIRKTVGSFSHALNAAKRATRR